jgi:hypothetical protein
MLFVIPSTAKVAIPAARPESRMSGSPTSSANTPPTASAIRSDGTFPTVLELRKSKRYGIVAGFSCSGMERTPAAHTPTAKKLMWPKESTPEFPTKT